MLVRNEAPRQVTVWLTSSAGTGSVCTVVHMEQHIPNGFTVYIGPGEAVDVALLEQRLDGAIPVDGADHSAVLAAAGGGLFGGTEQIIVERAELLDPHTAGALAAHGNVLGTVARSDTKIPKALQWLDAHAELVALDRRGVEQLLRTCFTRRGVRVDRDAAQQMLDVGLVDPGRVRSAARIAVMSGLTQVTGRVMTLLLGSTAQSAKVFDVADALWRGEIDVAVETAAGCDPVALALHLCDSAHTLAVAVDADAGTVQQLLGVHPYAAKLRVSTARRLGTARVEAALQASVAHFPQVLHGTIGSGGYLARIHLAVQDA